jgi:cysteine-rich repeat protein
VASDTGRCINAINKSMRKVTLAAAKEMRSCLAKKAGELLGSQTVLDCIAAAPGVQKATIGALITADNSCDGVPPAFGPHSISLHAPRAVQITQSFLQDLFGANPDAAHATNSLMMGCQSTVLKLSAKCEDLRINSFNKCKKEGLKRGFVASSVQLQSTCLGSGSTQPDPTGGKIDSTCVTVPSAKIESACVSRGVSLAAAFPGCGATTAAGVAQCADQRLKCRICNLLNDVDGLSRDCDLFDDNNDNNESCAEPPECGDADVESSDGCDDGGNLPGDGCSPLCTVEPGWTCGGEPSTCHPICGDGIVTANEQCDDGDTSSGDGCSATCTVETGYACVGVAPSICTTVCGDGILKPGEVCDDGGLLPGDGCSPTCTIEGGWGCGGEPRQCHSITRDSNLRGT